MNLFGSILRLKGYPLDAARKELSGLQAMSADEFRHWQQDKAWQIARFHYDNNPLYKKLVGDVFPTEWQDLPIVTKSDLQQPLQSMVTTCVKLADCHIGNTSGSTGQPFFYAKDKYAHAMTWAVIADRYAWYGLNFSSKQARFYGMPKEMPAATKEQLKDRAMNRSRFSVFDLSDNALAIFVHRFKTTAFKYIYGYTNSLVLFARHLLGKGLLLKELCPTLMVCISTSETCTPEDHKILEDAFGVPNVREYGVSETCLTAFDTKKSKWQLTEETLFTEIVDDNNSTHQSGEGKIISTSLYNTALPMVKYETGDIGIIAEKRELYRTLLNLSGRVNDTIQLPGGKIAAGLTFYYISRSVLETSGVLREFIIRQVAIGKFVFDIVADRHLTLAEVDLLKEKVSLYLAPGLDIIINKVDAIQRPASGKLKHFYSELN